MQLRSLDLIRQSMAANDWQACIVSHLPHIRRITGFTGSNALLFVSTSRLLLLTDGRYEAQVRQQSPDIEARIVSGSLLNALLDLDILPKTESVAIQGEYLSASEYASMASARHLEEQMVVTTEWLQPLFSSKSDTEVDAIANAQRITDLVFKEVVSLIRLDVTEKDLAAEIVYRHLKHGADGMSFDPIVAFGSNSALPHGRPTSRRLKANEAVLIDMGCFLEGYASDMTRTIFFGQPDEEFCTVYDIVNAARESASSAVRSGMDCRDLDGIARDIISDAGYGEYFVHSLGHGVGLEIHEWPSLSTRSSAVLRDNTVVTIEPGIYLPGKYGVRIEDIVVARPEGRNVLTSTSTELLVIPGE